MSKSSILLDLVCAQRGRMKALFALIITSGLFLAFSAVFVRPGDAAFPILIIDAVLVVGALAFFGATHRYCTKRAMDE